MRFSPARLQNVAPWLAAFALTAWLPVAVPAPAAERPRVVARAGEVALALHSVATTRIASHSFGPAGVPLSARATDRTHVTLELTLASRSADALAAVVPGPIGGASRFRATDDRGVTCPAVSGEVVAAGETTRLRLRFAELSSQARMFRAVEGALIAYPQARRVRFHVPWTKEDLPLSVEYEGARATLRRFHLVGDESTLWIAVHPPEGMRVAELDRPGSLAARAMDIYGNLVSGGAITETVRTQDGAEPEFRFYAPVLRRIPSRLMLDVLCTAGEPRPVPFKTTPISLPVEGVKR